MSDEPLYRPSNDNPYLDADDAQEQSTDADRTVFFSDADLKAMHAEDATVIRPVVQDAQAPARPSRFERQASSAASYQVQSPTTRQSYAAPSNAGIHASGQASYPTSRPHRDPEAARKALDAQIAAGYGYTADDSIPTTHPRRRGRKGRDQVRVGAEAPGRKPISSRRLRFWRWFRAWPIVIMILLGAAAYLLNTSIGAYAMRIFYPVKYAETITEAASKYGVDEDLIAAIIRTESSWKADAVSSVGAQGLMQIMPDTADFLVDAGYVSSSAWPTSNLLDPATNIQYGCAYVAYLEKTTGSQEETIAAYNAGPGVAAQWAAMPSAFTDAISYPETKLYVARVTNALSEYRTLYPDGLTNFSIV